MSERITSSQLGQFIRFMNATKSAVEQGDISQLETAGWSAGDILELRCILITLHRDVSILEHQSLAANSGWRLDEPRDYLNLKI